MFLGILLANILLTLKVNSFCGQKLVFLFYFSAQSPHIHTTKAIKSIRIKKTEHARLSEIKLVEAWFENVFFFYFV